MSKDFTIRASTPGDASALRACIDSVARERLFIAMLEAPTVAEIAAFVGLSHVRQLIAVSGDEVLGWVDVQRMQRSGFTHRGVLGMGVVSASRRQGIGNRLLSEMLEQSRASGIFRVELEVFRSNAAAIALYTRHGFQVEGEKVGARILDDISDDLVLMSRWDRTFG